MEIFVRTDHQILKYEESNPCTILQFLDKHGLKIPPTPCGGKGICGKCSIRISYGQCTEQVLSCKTMIQEGMIIFPETLAGEEAAILESGNCYIYPPDHNVENESRLVIACDIGTTTVVCHLLDRLSGKRLATVSRPNAQKVFGADVISRIQASMEGKLEQECACIRGQLEEMKQELLSRTDVDKTSGGEYTIPARDADLSENANKTPDDSELLNQDMPVDWAIAGNTVMCHILAGIAPDSIGRAPYQPQTLFGNAWNLGERFYIAPAVAGYVGGDIMADVLSTRMWKNKKPTLLLDIGTNGEMILALGEKLICCATAAGPAFEGAQIAMGMPACKGAISRVWYEKDANDKRRIQIRRIEGESGTMLCRDQSESGADDKEKSLGICGSGLIDAIAVFLELGIIDETGCFAEPEELEESLAKGFAEADEGMRFYLDDRVYISQADIRQVQLAKAAIAAGIKVLLKEAKITEEDIDELLLAGGFGTFLNPGSAARIGLIPQALLDRTIAVGNAAGEGAVSAAISQKARQDLAEIAGRTSYIELSMHSDFSDYYMEEMYFPEV